VRDYVRDEITKIPLSKGIAADLCEGWLGYRRTAGTGNDGKTQKSGLSVIVGVTPLEWVVTIRAAGL